MRKIGVCAAGVAVLILIGIGTWTGVGTETLTLAPSTVDSFAMMVSTADRPTIEYVDYTFVFTAD